jgi:hypothetical protein
VFDRDERHDRAFDELADEIKSMYRFDEIARRVIDATPAVSPDQDLLAFLAEVRKVATGYLNLKKEPEDRNVSHFSTVMRRGSEVQPRSASTYVRARAEQMLTRLCDECIATIGGAYSMEKEKERIRKLVARSAKCGPRKPVKTQRQLDDVRQAAAKAKSPYPSHDEHFRLLLGHAWSTFDVERLVMHSKSVDEFERNFHSFVIQSTYIVCPDSGCTIL